MLTPSNQGYKPNIFPGGSKTSDLGHISMISNLFYRALVFILIKKCGCDMGEGVKIGGWVDVTSSIFDIL